MKLQIIKGIGTILDIEEVAHAYAPRDTVHILLEGAYLGSWGSSTTELDRLEAVNVDFED